MTLSKEDVIEVHKCLYKMKKVLKEEHEVDEFPNSEDNDIKPVEAHRKKSEHIEAYENIRDDILPYMKVILEEDDAIPEPHKERV
jgi:hypothetical protein